jgi:hypothetical protein
MQRFRTAIAQTVPFGACLAILAFSSDWAQTAAAQHDNKPNARLLREFYHLGGSCEFAAILNELGEELKRDPDLRAHLIVYSGYTQAFARKQTPRGLLYRGSLAIQDALLHDMGVDPNRVKIVDGGRREAFMGQIWILPIGARPPEPTPDPKLQPYDDAENPFDEYRFRARYDSDTLMQFEGTDERLTGFAEEMSSKRGVTGYIIGYGSCNTTNSELRHRDGESDHMVVLARKCDKPRTGKKLAEKEKQLLVKEFGVDATRLVTVDGGFRPHNQTIELWVIPQNASPPQPTPTAFPREKAGHNKR